MADLFGVKPVRDYYNLANDCFIKIDHSELLMAGFPADNLQFFGDAEVYEPDGARVLAWLSAVPHRHAPYAAVTFAKHGQGHAALFAYDLGKTVVTLHQGRPENASTGTNANADRSGMFKTTSMHIKVLDERQKMLPQADLHQDILVRLVRAMTESALPLIRVWYFPNKQPAVAFLNGDSDGMEQRDLLHVLDLVEHYGAHYTVFLMSNHFDLVTPDLFARLQTMGHDLGPHPWAGTAKPTCEQMKEELKGICEGFEKHFGFQGYSLRTHGVIWVGWVDSALYIAANGVRIDTSFAAGRYYQEGFICGSGLPFRFMDQRGEIIDLYEQATLEMDDGSFTPKSLLPPLTQEEAVAHSITMIDRCIDLYHCVYHPYYHPYSTREEVYGVKRLEKVLQHLQRRGVMTVKGRGWAEFNDARRALHVSLKEVTPEEGRIIYHIEARDAIDRVTMMMPSTWQGSPLQNVQVEGSSVEIKRVNWEGGLDWVLFTLTLQAGQFVKVVCEYEHKYGQIS